MQRREKMKIAIGSDHGGFLLKENIKDFLDSLHIEYKDFGSMNEKAVDYPDIAFKVADEIKKGTYEKGILICGTGIGMSIAANKIRGIRAALCSDVFSARMTREHNDANILTLGGRVIGTGLAREIVLTWISSAFSQAKRHIERIEKISKIEENE